MPPIRTIEWIAARADAGPVPGCVRMIDQTRLPGRMVYIETHDPAEIFRAIRRLSVRGAPAIGIAAAMGVAAAAQGLDGATTTVARYDAAHRAAELLRTSRPTAVNLFWALDRMLRKARALRRRSADDFSEGLVREAQAIWAEDDRMCRAIGRHGATLLNAGDRILTHCNAGGLATSAFGTALAPLYHAAAQGLTFEVFADETRPLLQGARLTAWELSRAGIPVTVICDNTAGFLMQQGRIDKVFVGADRIAANGDTANKIGTYSVAVLAHHHRIPFYVLAPTSTFDLSLDDGRAIPIEMRDPKEVTHGFGRRTAPSAAAVCSPAFDVTPAGLITAIICEHGILQPVDRKRLAACCGASA